MQWLLSQFENFNVMEIIFQVFFTVYLSQKNTVELLNKESQKIHQEVEELKDEIRETKQK